MLDNNFITDTQKNNKPNFSGRFKFLLILAILLTGFISIPVLFFLPFVELGDTSSLLVILFTLCELCIFVTLIRIYKNKITIFKILTQCMRIISFLFLIASFFFPRLPYYRIPRFHILILDGDLFLIGILAAILASLIKEGIKMQTELDEIL